MKRFLLLLTMVGMIFTACEQGENIEEENGGVTSTPKIELSQQTIEVDFEPDNYSVNVISQYSWRATSYDNWITIVSKTGVAGEEKLTFKTSRNMNEEERKGAIVLRNTDFNLVAELYIIQKPFVPFIECPDSLFFSNKAESCRLDITANFDYTLSNKADWLGHVFINNDIEIFVKENKSLNERKADIYIVNKDCNIRKNLVVIQNGLEPTIAIDITDLHFDASGGKQKVKVQANIEFDYISSADWISCTKYNNSIEIEVSPSTTTTERAAEVIVYLPNCDIYKTIKVKQEAFVPKLEIEDVGIVEFDYIGGSKKIQIVSNIEYEVLPDAEWLSIEKENGYINIIVTSNDLFEKRTAEITISNEEYNISKVVSLSQEGILLEGNKNILLYTSSDGRIIILDDTFGANIVCNVYQNGQGVILFDSPITRIGKKAFSGYNRLTSITIPDSVTLISEEAFSCCGGLFNVTIPDSVTSIGDYAFYNCTSLTSVTIGNRVTSIGKGAFKYCSSLTSITIPDSTTSIGDEAFCYCTSLKAFYGKFASSDNRALITTININNRDYNQLKAYALASGMTYSIPDSIGVIGEYAFASCNSLTSITIPNSVTRFRDSAFSNCTSLKEVYYQGDLSSWCKIDFDWDPLSYTNPLSNGAKLYINNEELSELVIPSDIDVIKINAFHGCSSLISVSTSGARLIEAGAFRDCNNLLRVDILSNVRGIGVFAFNLCESLETVYCRPRSISPIIRDNVWAAFCSKVPNFKIYVPKNSVIGYKNAEYWDMYANDIVGYDF